MRLIPVAQQFAAFRKGNQVKFLLLLTHSMARILGENIILWLSNTDVGGVLSF